MASKTPPPKASQLYERFVGTPKEETREKAPGEAVLQLSLDEVHPFPHHPFKLYTGERMDEMIDSVRHFGVMTPIHVRADRNGGYEILAGHNRVYAARQAGLTTIPALLFDLDDDEAVVWMVDSNLRQRDRTVASELAFALKMKLEAIKRQGERSDLTSVGVRPKSRSNALLAEETGFGSTKVKQYIRLTNLISPLLRRVDKETLPLAQGEALSFLTIEQQTMLYGFLGDHKPLSMRQAEELKRLSLAGALDHAAMLRVMAGAAGVERKFSIDREQLRPYIPSMLSDDEVVAYIIQALDAYRTFDSRPAAPNAETLEAMREGDKIVQSGKGRFDIADDLLRELKT